MSGPNPMSQNLKIWSLQNWKVQEISQFDMRESEFCSVEDFQIRQN